VARQATTVRRVQYAPPPMSIAVTLCQCLSAILLCTAVERAFSQSGLFNSWTWYFYQTVVVMAPVSSAKCLGTSVKGESMHTCCGSLFSIMSSQN